VITIYVVRSLFVTFAFPYVDLDGSTLFVVVYGYVCSSFIVVGLVGCCSLVGVRSSFLLRLRWFTRFVRCLFRILDSCRCVTLIVVGSLFERCCSALLFTLICCYVVTLVTV